MTDKPAVAVVIVTFNSGRQVGDCLSALRAGCDGVDLVQVVVADNASRDDSVAVARNHTDLPMTVLDRGVNDGYAAGINAAVAAVTGADAVLVLNPDIRVRPGAVARLAAALDPDHRRAMVVPMLVNPDGSPQPSLRRAATPARALAEALLGGSRAARLGRLGELIVDPAAYRDGHGGFAWATGAAVLVSGKAAVELGPWDESLLLYGEETEYMLRAADLGWELWFEPAAVFEHIAGDAYRTSPALHALMTTNKVDVYGRRHGPVRRAAYRAAVTAGELLRAAQGRETSRAAVLALVRPARRVRALPG